MFIEPSHIEQNMKPISMPTAVLDAESPNPDEPGAMRKNAPMNQRGVRYGRSGTRRSASR